MKKPVRFAVLTAVAFSLVAGLAINANAQANKNPLNMGGPATTTTTQKCTLTSTDKRFLEQMNQVNLLEQKLGQLAQSKAESNDVKSYGQRLVNDHSQNETDLKNLCESKSVKYSNDLDKANQATFNKLDKLSGAQFDKSYINEMIKGHRQALQLARTAEKTAKEKDIKEYASKTASAVDEHLKLALDTEKKIASERTKGKTAAGKAGGHY